MMETIVRTSSLATLREQTTLFVLSTTPAEASYLQPVRDALNKASLPPLSNSDLPVVSTPHPLTGLVSRWVQYSTDVCHDLTTMG